MWNIPIGNDKGEKNAITHTKKFDTGLAKYENTGLTQQHLKQIANLKMDKKQ